MEIIHITEQPPLDHHGDIDDAELRQQLFEKGREAFGNPPIDDPSFNYINPAHPIDPNKPVGYINPEAPTGGINYVDPTLPPGRNLNVHDFLKPGSTPPQAPHQPPTRPNVQ